jgi:hypothetical protein
MKTLGLVFWGTAASGMALAQSYDAKAHGGADFRANARWDGGTPQDYKGFIFWRHANAWRVQGVKVLG